ncbi:hypothetical protein [Methanoregula sp.]|uniref:hypothetical protein n=1 Tax=Methanoregula sp. TaxID=2052170 RepID=UPI000CBDC5E4|nr:hypothetical protein [Methanoregula sp.]PKG32628.1 MAG: hypothetical protein CW742_07140 [Methanoregula sp.]
MDDETKESSPKCWCDVGHTMKHHACHGSGGALYFVGFLGALYYYLTTATSFLAGVIGVVKALLWPAFLVYGVLKYLGM